MAGESIALLAGRQRSAGAARTIIPHRRRGGVCGEIRVSCLKGTVQPGTLGSHGGCPWSRKGGAPAKAPSYTGQWGQRERRANSNEPKLQGARTVGLTAQRGCLSPVPTRGAPSRSNPRGKGGEGVVQWPVGGIAAPSRSSLSSPLPFAAVRWPCLSLCKTPE